ncbi:hypothetical protein [Streptomyces sp. NPDC001205]
MRNPPTRNQPHGPLTRLRRRAVRATATSAVLVMTSAQMAVAAPGSGGTNVTTGGLNSWIQNNIVNIGLLIVGLVIIFRGKSKDWSGALVTGGIAIVGLVFVALGTGQSALGIGNWLLGLIGVGGGKA